MAKAAAKPRTLNLTDLLSALPKLKPKELATVKAAIEQLQPKEEFEGDIQLLYYAILNRLNIIRKWSEFEGTAAYRDFKKNAPGAVLFIKRTFKPPNKTSTIAVMRLLIWLLMDDLIRKREIAATLGSVCRNLHLLPMVFDDNFPHYRESGLVPMLMKQMEK